MAQGLELMGRDARLLHPDSDLEFMQYVPYQFKAGRDYVYVWGPGRHGQLSPIKLLRFDVAMASRCSTTDPLLAPPPMPYQGGLISSPDSINLGEAVYGAPALGWAAAGEGVAAAAAATGGGDGNGECPFWPTAGKFAPVARPFATYAALGCTRFCIVVNSDAYSAETAPACW